MEIEGHNQAFRRSFFSRNRSSNSSFVKIQELLVMRRILVLDSKDSKHLGFFREKKGSNPKWLVSNPFFRETFWGNGGEKERREEKSDLFLLKKVDKT